MDYKQITEKIWGDVEKAMPDHLRRLSWSKDKLRNHQTNGLRAILNLAKEQTVFYGEVLKSVNTYTFNLEDLSTLPPTDKTLHMEKWDDFVAAPGITCEIAENHLEGIRKGELKNPFYNENYLFLTTGGSTGKRGLFIWDSEFLKEMICATYRYLIDSEAKKGYHGPMRLATVEAPTLVHGSQFVFSCKPLPQFELLSLTAIDPIPEQCEKLNNFKPNYLMAYASSAAELASAQIRGELEIEPRWVCTNSGPLDDDMRDRIKRAWGIKTCNSWGCTEIGEAAVEIQDTPGMIIWEDGVILEVVDDNLNPVTDPKDAAKLLATSLVNKSLPMIRYEIDDLIEIGKGYTEYPAYSRIMRILGRATDWLLYNGIKVHPMAFRDILDAVKEVEEFQVIQTEEGGNLKLVCNGEPNKEEIIETIKTNLIKDGLKDPVVTIEIVNSLPRQPETGKIKRFVPLKK